MQKLLLHTRTYREDGAVVDDRIYQPINEQFHQALMVQTDAKIFIQSNTYSTKLLDAFITAALRYPTIIEDNR